MNEIRIQKIDWVEFVTYKDYLRLKEEKEKMLEEIKILKQSIMQDEWDTIPKLEEENKKLQEERDEYKERWERSFSA